MKKSRLLALLAMLPLLLCTYVSAQVIKKGDANGDGVINATDIMEVLNYLAEQVTEKFVPDAADVNSDGVVDVADVEGIMNIILGISDEKEAEVTDMLKNQAYEGLYYQSANPTTMSYFVSCLASDEMLGGGGNGDNLFHQLDLLGDVDMTEAWNNYRQYITQTNEVISRLKDIDPELESSSVRHGLGEALFLRAYYYHELATLFGTVPVITNNDSWEERMKTTTPEDVWGQIMLDLKQAVDLMFGYSPTLKKDDSRVGKYAAEALLARSYLFFTGFYMGVHDIAETTDANVTLPDGSVLTKEEVVAMINDCVKNSGFGLVGDYRNLWPYTNRLTVEDYSYTQGQNLAWVEDDGKVNPEVLFKIKYNKKGSWNTTIGYSNIVALYMGMRSGGTYASSFPFGQGWGAGSVSPGLVSEWKQAEPGDMRLDASIQDMGQMDYNTSESFVQETSYYEKKLSPISCRDDAGGYAETFEKIMYGEGWDCDNFMQLGNIHPLNLIRFADVLLMQSELTGTVDGINKVRQRAGLAPITTYSLSALQEERRWELAFEGVRWNDMRRWGDDYCKAALDKQMDQPIKNDGVVARNPQGVSESVPGFTSYAENYAKNHGFFAKPAGQNVVGGEIIERLQGSWILDETPAAGCYGTMKYEHAPIAQFLNKPTENGLLKRYSREEMKSLPGTFDRGEFAALSYIEFSGTSYARYNVGGELLASGSIEIIPTDNYDWRICSIRTNGRMMFGGKDETTIYDVVNLAKSGQLMLVDATNATKDDEVAYWSLAPISYDALNVRMAHGVKWSYAQYEGRDYMSGQIVVIGTWGSASHDYQTYGNNVSVPVLYAPQVEGVLPENLAGRLSDLGVDVTNGEADPFAYMVLDFVDETVSKYTSDGRLISSGPIQIQCAYSTVTVKASADGNILAPYSFINKGAKQDEYQVKCNLYSMPGNKALVFRGTDYPLFSYWFFGQRGLTSEELQEQLLITQQDYEGNPDSQGNCFTIGNDIDLNYLQVVCEDGTVVGYDRQTGIFKIKSAIDETETKTLTFTLKNVNGIMSTAQHTMTVTNKEPPSAEYLKLIGSGSKSWTWDTSVSGTAWGNMGYCGGNGSVVGTTGEGQWWGISTSEEFNDMLHHTDDGVNHGDGDLNAYMTFSNDGKIVSYNANGTAIRNGSFDVIPVSGNNWRVADLQTTAGAILWPYEMNSGGNMPKTFEMVYLTDEKMTLVYPDGGNFSGLGNWGEATYWHFKSK